MDAKVKERVIRIATDLFLRHGIKAITMDYIAGQLGMSKRTLYEIFKDKDSLLLSCVQYVDEERAKDAEEIKKGLPIPLNYFFLYIKGLYKN